MIMTSGNGILRPQTTAELAEALATAGARLETVTLAGASSKRRMAGAVEPADIVISTGALDRLRQYEPRDLTVSVEAGMRWCELTRLLAANRQMVPLDPPFADTATVGGVVAANCSGPRRRLYGTARDFVIGMRFATLEGRVAESGGMVVKNVAGLDTAKLLIGSFGTLAAIVSVNFKVAPLPERERSFVLSFASLEEAMTARDIVLRSVLQPAAVDALNPAAAGRLGLQGHVLAVQAGGTPAALARCQRELEPLGAVEVLEGQHEAALWRGIREFVPAYLAIAPEGGVVRVSSTIADVPAVLASAPGPAVARAGSGVTYACFEDCIQAAAWAAEACRRGMLAVVEFAPEARKRALELWPLPGGDLDLMTRVKRLFDPRGLLNRGRLYGRI